MLVFTTTNSVCLLLFTFDFLFFIDLFVYCIRPGVTTCGTILNFYNLSLS